MKNAPDASAPQWDRRAFLRALGVLGVGAVIGGGLKSLIDIVRLRGGLVGVSRSRLLMGTYVTMTVVHESERAAEEAIGWAFEEINRLIAVFSRHDPSTAVSALNRDGHITMPPPELVDVMQRSVVLHGVTSGAFDVTVQPLVDLYAEWVAADRARDTLPQAIETDDRLARAIAEARSRVGIDKLEISSRRIDLWDGAGITLDGIAKGFIVDRASDVLLAMGSTSHMVNAGGDIRTRGSGEDGRPWTIAVQDPRKRGRYPDVIRLGDGAVATSGDYEVYFDRERLHHHVIDPATGLSPAADTSVSVVAKTVVEADALSTAVFVMGASDGVRLIEAMRGNECLVVSRSGRVSRSSRWPSAA